MTAAEDEELLARAQARVGSVLKDKWTLDRLIGIGGMAVVYAATHRNRKRAAIKMLHPELSIDGEIRNRFLREGYVANSVEHPGAVRVDDDDINDDGSAFLVMELLEGESLDARRARKGGSMPPGEVLTVTDQLLDVIAAAHDKGIVHRDLKPENLFLTREGKIKVLDFGIARVLEISAKSSATRAGSLMGTPAFMAPEQARGRWDEVNARTDLWAVGATMFVLLTGRLVHVAETPNEALGLAMMQPAPRIETVLPSVPAPVAAIVNRALSYATQDRFADAREMQAAVREAAEALSSSAAQPARTAMLSIPETTAAPAVTLRSEQSAPPSVGAEPAVVPSPSMTTARAITAEPRRLASGRPKAPPWLPLGLAGGGALVLLVIVVAVAIGAIRKSRTEAQPEAAASSTASASEPVAAATAPSAPTESAEGAVSVDDLPAEPAKDEKKPEPGSPKAIASAPKPTAKPPAESQKKTGTPTPAKPKPTNDPFARRR